MHTISGITDSAARRFNLIEIFCINFNGFFSQNGLSLIWVWEWPQHFSLNEKLSRNVIYQNRNRCISRDYCVISGYMTQSKLVCAFFSFSSILFWFDCFEHDGRILIASFSYFIALLAQIAESMNKFRSADTLTTQFALLEWNSLSLTASNIFKPECIPSHERQHRNNLIFERYFRIWKTFCIIINVYDVRERMSRACKINSRARSASQQKTGYTYECEHISLWWILGQRIFGHLFWKYEQKLPFCPCPSFKD